MTWLKLRDGCERSGLFVVAIFERRLCLAVVWADKAMTILRNYNYMFYMYVCVCYMQVYSYRLFVVGNKYVVDFTEVEFHHVS